MQEECSKVVAFEGEEAHPEQVAIAWSSPGKSKEELKREEKEKREAFQKEAEEALVEAGWGSSVALVKAPGLPGRKKGQKNKRKSQLPALYKGAKRSRTELSAAAKLKVHETLEAARRNPATSVREAKRKLESELQVSQSFLYRQGRTQQGLRLARFLAERSLGKTGLRKQGSAVSLQSLLSRSEGKRLPVQTPLGKPDHQRKFWQQTAAWAKLEEANGHDLSAKDLLRDFLDRLEAAISVREEASSLTPQEQKELASWKQKLTSLSNNSKQRERYSQQLVVRSDMTPRSCQRATELSPEEERSRVQLAWRIWDTMLVAAASGNPDKIAVCNPEQWVLNVRETALTFSDQIPVWLKVEPGKLLTSKHRLRLASEQRKLRREQKKAGEQVQSQVRLSTARKSPGKPPRWRVSFVARQAVTGYLDPENQKE